MATVEIPIYRAASRDYEDNESGHRWAFTPIEGGVNARQGLVTGSWDDSDEPLAVIVAPAGSRIAETNCGDMALFLPGRDIGYSPWDSYAVARARDDGLSLKRRASGR